MNRDDLCICIPTYGRGVQAQRTWRSLPAVLWPRTFFVVRPEEARDFRAEFGATQVLELPGADPMGRPMTLNRVRQWLVTNAPTDLVMNMDDDFVFAARMRHPETKLAPLEGNAEGQRRFVTIIDCMETWLRQKAFAHMGIGARGGNNRRPEMWDYNTRLAGVFAHDMRVLRSQGIRFDRVATLEDFDVTLQLLRRGYGNASCNTLSFDQPHGSNAAGGCSTYRTWELQKEAAHALAELHPGFVRASLKPTKNWGGWPERWDVTCQWKKAYASARGLT